MEKPTDSNCNTSPQPIVTPGFSSYSIEYKQTENALRASENRFRAAIDNLPELFAIYDKDLRVQYINPAGLARCDDNPEAIIGHTDEELYPPEITQSYMPALRRALETKTKQKTECYFNLPTGEMMVEGNFVPLIDESGEVYQILSISHDVTKHKKSEEALRSSEEQLRLALSGAEAGMWIYDHMNG